MSVRATNWAWELARKGAVGGGRLLTLLRVADHADNDGICWPGEKSLAEYTGNDERTVRRHLGRLEGDCLLHRERQGSEKGRGRGKDRIILHLDQADKLSGVDSGDQPDISGTSTGHSVHDQPDTHVRPIDGEPSKEPSEPTQSVRKRVRVARKPVTDAEHDLATAIVAAFNVKAGTQVTVDAHLTPIVGRIREKPNLTAADHRGIIAAVFAADRWWKGPPSPSVIYGNAAQFERSIEVWRAAPAPLRAVEPPVDVARFTEGRAAAEADWPAIRERLRAAVSDSAFRLWIEPLDPAGAAGDTLLLAAPESVVTWAERRYSALITEALEAAGAPWIKVGFTTRPDDSSEGERQAA